MNNEIDFESSSASWKEITQVDTISRKDFFNDFVKKKRPLLIRKQTQDWKALHWNTDYFKSKERGVKVNIKHADVSQGVKEKVLLSQYVDMVDEYEMQVKNNIDVPALPYLHDMPFFRLFPEYIPDIEPFPLHLFPKWYWRNWHNYIQFFMSSTGSLTPLHFDTLWTNNLFFQVVGKKKFILMPAEQIQYVYMDGWRWAKYDPNDPNFDQYPLSKSTTPVEVIVEAGDILFLPSGTLHQVHGLSHSVSFNIDWHTARSAREGMMTVFKGAPSKNAYYNFICYLGLAFKIPSKYIYRYYSSYLEYVS